MSDQSPGQDLPPPNTTGHVQQPVPTQFTMTVEEAVARYVQLGHPRNPRSVRRFCQQGTIDCRKVRTSNFSELYLIDSASVDRHVKEIAETFPIVPRDLSAQDQPSPAVTGHDQPSPAVKIEGTHDVRYVALLEKVNADQAGQLKIKDEQLKIKDTQIGAMLERDRETNFLIRGLQTLLGLPDRRDSSTSRDIPKEPDTGGQPFSTTS
jgi:hypothetical protein